MSEWPNNSSQAYLISNLVSDVSKNSKASIESISNGYQIKTTVNYPNNPKLVSEVIKTDKDFNLKSVDIMDEENNILMNVEFKDINYKPNFSRDYFDLKVTDKSEESENEDKKLEDCRNACKEDEECKNSCTTKSTSNILEDIVYPLYVPVDTYLSSKDTVETKDGNRVILTFAGVDPFILVEEVANFSSDMEVIPVSGEPLQIGASIGALSDNSLYFTSNGIDYYITSNTLKGSEMKLIAESITNGTNLVAGVK